MIRAATQFYKVETIFFEDSAKLFCFFGLEALILELDTIDLDAETEIRFGAFVDGFCDFDKYLSSVSETTTVLVCSNIGRLGDKLRQEISVGCKE